MRINELLNASARPPAPAPAPAGQGGEDWDMDRAKPAPAAAGRRRMDMASLGPLPQASMPPAPPPAEDPAAWARPRPDLSLSRIIQELETAQPRPAAVHSVRPAPPSAAAASKVAATASPTASAAARPGRRPANQTAAASAARRPRGRLGPLSDAAKRVKQRMLVKRSYYRKLDTLSELREQVEALERDFQRVLRASPAPPPAAGAASVPAAAADALRTRFAQLAVAQDALRRENERLRAQAMDQSKMGTRVRILLDEERRDQQAARAALERVHRSPLAPAARSPLGSPRPAGTQVKPATPPAAECAAGVRVAGLTIRALTAADCGAVTAAAVADVRAFRAAETRAESTGASVFGWRDRRRVDADGRTLRFCLEKTFRQLPARELARRMWALVSTSAGLSRVYASARSTRFVLLQRVDARHVLFYREMRADGGQTVKSLVLAALVDLGEDRDERLDAGADRFLVLVRSVDPHALVVGREDEREQEAWTDVFSWGVYESAGPEGQHCRNAFGGFVRTSPEPPPPLQPSAPGAIRADAAFWLLLVLVIAVRCESEVVGSPVLLPGDADE